MGRRSESMFLRDLKPAKKDHIEHVRSRNHGESSWQSLLLEFVHSNAVQCALLVLLVWDILGMFVGLFLDSEYPSCHYVVRDAVCDNGGVVQCDTEGKYPAVEALSKILEVVSPIVLTLFMLENCALLAALGVRKFFSNVMYTLDFFVVSVSAVFEASKWFIDDTVLADLVQIIIMARLWRFVSLCYDLLSIQHEHDAESIKMFKERIDQLERLLEKNHVVVPPPPAFSTSTAKTATAEGGKENTTTLSPQGDEDENYHRIS